MQRKKKKFKVYEFFSRDQSGCFCGHPVIITVNIQVEKHLVEMIMFGYLKLSAECVF